jgi:hypothetical protein
MMDLGEERKEIWRETCRGFGNGLELNAALFAALAFLEFLGRGEIAPVCFACIQSFLGLLILFAFLFDDCTIVFTRKGDMTYLMSLLCLHHLPFDICEYVHACVC